MKSTGLYHYICWFIFFTYCIFDKNKHTHKQSTKLNDILKTRIYDDTGIAKQE